MKPHTKATTLHAKPSANFAEKLAATQAQLKAAATELRPLKQASSLGAEDVVITHILNSLQLDIPVFVLETGALHSDTLALLERLQAFAAAQNAPVVAISAKLEAELSEMGDEDRLLFLQELGQTEPGLNRLIRSAYRLLGLQTYFTAGVKEVRAWTIHVGDTGPQAAGVIHTDFEKGYIRAQTIAFEDFIQFRGEQGAKDAGKMRAEGKEYVVKDGDVMNFLFSS
jgi:ribosome-binding ATPase YchF (GTP1/OBG family)